MDNGSFLITALALSLALALTVLCAGLAVWVARLNRALARHLETSPTHASPTPAPEPSKQTDEAVQHMQAEAEAFSYTISHDLRAPLRVVEGFGKILKEDYGSRLDRVGNDHLERIMSAASRMNLMIDALLSLSKLSSQPLRREAVDLSVLAQQIGDELRQQEPGREAHITIEPGLIALGDGTLLRMVLENLLGNAWKYSSKCPVTTIRVKRHPTQAHTFTVQDQGAGFDMRFAKRLFGAFQRLHSANDFQGHGVGLASVRRIVARHGGTIWAESAVGQGATFHFSLAPEAQTAIAAREPEKNT